MIRPMFEFPYLAPFRGPGKGRVMAWHWVFTTYPIEKEILIDGSSATKMACMRLSHFRGSLEALEAGSYIAVKANV